MTTDATRPPRSRRGDDAKEDDMTVWTIREIPAGYAVEEMHDESSFPTNVYPTKRAAAARLLQLMGLGPVRPQMHPERVCIGFVETAAADE